MDERTWPANWNAGLVADRGRPAHLPHRCGARTEEGLKPEPEIGLPGYRDLPRPAQSGLGSEPSNRHRVQFQRAAAVDPGRCRDAHATLSCLDLSLRARRPPLLRAAQARRPFACFLASGLSDFVQLVRISGPFGGFSSSARGMVLTLVPLLCGLRDLASDRNGVFSGFRGLLRVFRSKQRVAKSRCGRGPVLRCPSANHSTVAYHTHASQRPSRLPTCGTASMRVRKIAITQRAYCQCADLPKKQARRGLGDLWRPPD